jgi:RimJ/RimL family protein N-acetyltransferase
MDVKIRTLKPEDAIGYIAFLEQIDRETNFLLWEPGERDLEVETVRSKISQADENQGIRLVAEAEGSIVGFLVANRGLSRRIQHRANIVVGVLRQAWGRGIGTALLDRFEAWARERGIWRLELSVMAHNQRAIELYEGLGYVREGLKRSAILVDGQEVDEIIMGKILR